MNITYYIQAERVLHNFAPGGLVDLCTGLPLTGETSVSPNPSPFPHTLSVSANVGDVPSRMCGSSKYDALCTQSHKWILWLDWWRKR